MAGCGCARRNITYFWVRPCGNYSTLFGLKILYMYIAIDWSRYSKHSHTKDALAMTVAVLVFT